MSNNDIARRLLRRHPLQRLESPSRSFSAFVHIVGLASFAYSFRYLVVNPNPINESYGWHLQYLTIVGLSLAASTFLFGFLADATLSPQLFLAKNALAVASAPLEVLISILYWSLRSIDQSLVLPDFAPPLSLSDDFSFHAAPALLLVTDLLFLSPPWTISALPAIGLSAFIAFGYWFWVELCYSHNGYYPYPLFEQLQTPYRIALFAGSALVMSCSTWCLKWLYERVNGRSIEEGVDGEEKSRSGDVKKG